MLLGAEISVGARDMDWSPSKRFIVGVCDKDRAITNLLVENLGRENVLVYADDTETYPREWFTTGRLVDKTLPGLTPGLEEEEKMVWHVALAKELFLTRIDHAVVRLEHIESLSLLTGVILALLHSRVLTLAVVGASDIETIVRLGQSSEQGRVQALLGTGRIHVTPTFSIAEWRRMARV
ncbi:MAG: hypothetical protein M3O61_06680 [Gemmatimonadota bacterium]|nr:hypothetical protein [Gemmatimonadota bacterium]